MTRAVGPNGDETRYGYYGPNDPLAGASAATVWIVEQGRAGQPASPSTPCSADPAVTSIAYDFSQGGSADLHHHRHGRPPQPDCLHPEPPRQPDADRGAARQDDRHHLAAGRLERHPEGERDGRRESAHRLRARRAGQPDQGDDQEGRGRARRHRVRVRPQLQQAHPQGGSRAAGDDLRHRPHDRRRRQDHGRRRQRRPSITTTPTDGSTGAKDPRGFTTLFRDFNDFGSPREIENPLGQVTSRIYDARNRLIVERQEPFGRETRVVYDGFDRPVERLRLSGTTSEDERTLTEYYPGGQMRATTNALGTRTEYHARRHEPGHERDHAASATRS